MKEKKALDKVIENIEKNIRVMKTSKGFTPKEIPKVKPVPKP